MHDMLRLVLLGACVLAACDDADPGRPADVAAEDARRTADGAPADGFPALDAAADAAADVAVDGAPDAWVDATAEMPDAAPPRRPLDPLPVAGPPPPPCGAPVAERPALVPGPGLPGHDAALADAVRRFDRQFHALNARGTGLNADVRVSDPAARGRIADFLRDGDAWEDESVVTGIAAWGKATGAFAGPGAAADAWRYGALRDAGADCAEVARARAHLQAALDGMHLAQAITGVDGVIARAIARADQPGDGVHPVVPLFDEAGQPLPPQKNNGTWRADQSGRFPAYAWEDSASRDQLIGWVIGMAAAWEVIQHDPTFDDAAKARLRADSAAIARSLMRVNERGYDLEIHDADGRVTYHGYLSEHALDRAYVPALRNGFNALMALGIAAGLAYVAGADDVDAWLYDVLLGPRALHAVVTENLELVDLGVRSNFSNYNMAFEGGWLAARYLRDAAARAAVRDAVRQLYQRPGRDRQPAEQGQTFYDFTWLLAEGGADLWSDLQRVDEAALARGLATLIDFPPAPAWDVARQHCDDAEIAAGRCTAEDGSEIELAPGLGHNDAVVAARPLPIALRPPSNWYWRSNPYQVNGGGDGAGLPAGNDLRFVYWMGRWVRRGAP